MPTYDYQCRVCGTVTEVIHSMLETGPSTCERCGGELRRVLYPAGIIFKGSGFYRTDSRSGAKGSSDDKPADAAASRESGSTSGAPSDSTGGSAKTEAGSPGKASPKPSPSEASS